MSETFQELSSSQSFLMAEEELLHTNSSYVSSDILAYWHLKPEIIDSIRYSADIMNAPLQVRSLAIANYVVYTLIDLDARIMEEIPDEIYFLLSEEGLDPQPLLNAMEYIQSI